MAPQDCKLLSVLIILYILYEPPKFFSSLSAAQTSQKVGYTWSKVTGTSPEGIGDCQSPWKNNLENSGPTNMNRAFQSKSSGSPSLLLKRVTLEKYVQQNKNTQCQE